MDGEHPLFTTRFVGAIHTLVERHHSIYPRIPPQGIFFESLVERAFLAVGWPRNQVIPTAPNSPSHDLTVGAAKIAVKTGNRAGHEADSYQHHEALYDRNRRMGLGSAYPPRVEPFGTVRPHSDAPPCYRYHYQLLEIPLDLLRRIDGLTAQKVGTREGRRSLGMDVLGEGGVLFHVHFDGADGKCQIQRLRVENCRMLLEWDQPTDA